MRGRQARQEAARAAIRYRNEIGAVRAGVAKALESLAEASALGNPFDAEAAHARVAVRRSLVQADMAIDRVLQVASAREEALRRENEEAEAVQ